MARWVEEFHVDGFRFDLASALCRDPRGEPMAVPPLIEEIAKDPVLSKVPLPLQATAEMHLYMLPVYAGRLKQYLMASST